MLEWRPPQNDCFPAWHLDALCAEPEYASRADALFFPAQTGATSEAKAICASCLVRRECLSWALTHCPARLPVRRLTQAGSATSWR